MTLGSEPDRRDALAVKKDPLPDLEVGEEPEAITVFGATRPMLVR
jgi:hypothetical protein